MSEVGRRPAFGEATLQRFGAIHILVNNAGSVPAIKFSDVSDEQWYDNLERKLMGFLRVTREVLPHMQKSGWGRIVNVAGTAGWEPSNTSMAVGINNAAVINWTKSMSLQYAGDGILVNTVAPGSIDTPRQVGNRQREAEVTGKNVEEIRQARVKDIPLGRLGWPRSGESDRFSRFGVFQLYDRHLCHHRWWCGARDLTVVRRSWRRYERQSDCFRSRRRETTERAGQRDVFQSDARKHQRRLLVYGTHAPTGRQESAAAYSYQLRGGILCPRPRGEFILGDDRVWPARFIRPCAGGVSHTFGNASTTTSRLLIIHAPAWMPTSKNYKRCGRAGVRRALKRKLT